MSAGALASSLISCAGPSSDSDGLSDARVPTTGPTTQSAPPTATDAPATATLAPDPTSASPTAMGEGPSAGPPAHEEAAGTRESTASPDRASLTAHWPETTASRVVQVRHRGLAAGDRPDSDVVLEMLDAGLCELAECTDSMEAWRLLFDPSDRVLLKVNCISAGGPTQPAVTYAIAERLVGAGLASERVLIFDRLDYELEAAGYALNDGLPGVQCHGSKGPGSEAVLSQGSVRFHKEIDACDAIINVPTPKQHGMAGVSVSLKNHYGSINTPAALHGNACDPGIAELNAQQPIRGKTRLIVGAALRVTSGHWDQPEPDGSLLLSFDPVALDTVARDMLVRRRVEAGQSAEHLIQRSIHLETAQGLGVGATNPERIDLREIELT